jgi:hypothetical protein
MWVPLVEQELLTLPERDLSSPPVFSGVRVTRSLVLYHYVCFVYRWDVEEDITQASACLLLSTSI